MIVRAKNNGDDDQSTRLFIEPSARAEALSVYTLPLLNDILKACGLETSSGQSKDQVVGRVAEHIFDPIESAKTIESLSNDERHLLEQIAAQEMVVSVGELVSTEGSLTLTKDLVIKGLVLAGRDLKSDPLRRGRPFDLERLESAQVVCPKFVGPLLSGEPVEIPVRSVSGLVESQTSDLRDLEHDLAAMADAINEGGVRPLKSGLPGKRFMRQVNPSLRVPDHLKDVDRIEESTRLLFVFELLDSLGVVKRHRGRLVLSSLTDEIFAADITDRAQGLFEAWLESAWWHELYHVGTVCLARKSPDWDNGDGQIDDLPTHDGLISARRVVLDVLGQAASESWVLMDDIAEAIRISSRGFLMRPPNRTYYGRATIYTGVGEVGAAKPSFVWGGAIEREGSWHRVEGAFIKEVIATSLHWLGIVDIGSVAVEDGLDFSVCRLTQIGRWLAGGTARPVNRQQSGTARSIVVQPTFEVSVFPEGQDLSILWPLHRFAEPIGYETVRTYRLTAESVHRAIEQGGDAQIILGFLVKHSRSELPKTVANAIVEWGRRATEITVTQNASILESESVLEMESWIETIEDQVVRRLTPTLAVVSDRAAPLPPMPTVDYTQPLGVCLDIDDDASITPTSNVVHWGVRHLLERLAEPTGDTSVWQVTKTSVRNAVKRHLHYETAARFLSEVSGSPLPMRARLKLQGLFGQLGPAVAGEGIVVIVKNVLTMDALLSFRDLDGVWLRRLGPMAALVDRDMWPTLQRLLDEFGIAVDSAAMEEREQTDAQPKRVKVKSLSSKNIASVLRRAIDQRQPIALTYKAASSILETTVDPIALRKGALTAECRSAKAVQTFRLDRIQGVAVVAD